MSQKYPNLSSPMEIGGVRIKNRFCVAPMQLGSLMGPYGEFSDTGIAYYEERAKGGFGLIITGAMMSDMEVDPFSSVDGKAPLRAPNTFLRTAYEMLERLSAYDCKMFPQITMGQGRNVNGCYAPSEIPCFFDPNQTAPALTTDQVKKKIELMVKTTAFMKECGFPGVEVHAMHWGYLLDQFAMALTNHRTDEYGGTLENRMRAAKEICEGIKQVCGEDFAVTMRIGLKSYVKGLNQASLFGEEEAGRTLEEGVRISQMLESYGYDALDVDVGIYDSFYYAEPPIYMPKCHVIELAAAVRGKVGIPVLCGSRMSDPDLCEQAVADGKINGVVLGRPSLADPHYPQKVEMGCPEKIRPCIACNQGCIHALFAGKAASCAVNPAAGREFNFGLSKALAPKKVVVVGGGIAGMEAARTATLRGHQVSLYEKSDNLGGNVIPGGQHSFKKEMRELNEWYQNELKELGVDVHRNSECTARQILDGKPDAVVLAVGSVPVMPKLPGSDNAKVCNSIDALMGKKEIGQNVVVVGGGLVGCEMAYEYAKEGKNVTVVEALPSILSAGEAVPIMNSMMLNDLLEHYKVKVLTGHRLASVDDEGVTITGEDGEKKIAADSVVMAVGYKPRESMAQQLREAGIEVYQVGDGKKVGNVCTSITDAYTVARSI